MTEYSSSFLFDNPALALLIAAVLIVIVYIFARQLSPNEMKRFSLYMSIGISILILMFILAIFIPQIVPFYPFIIFGLAIAICIHLYKKSKIE